MRKRYIFGSIAVALLLGLAVAVGLYAYDRISRQRELDDIVAELDRTDPGWQLDDLEQARPAIAGADDSAALIRKLHAGLPAKWLTEDPDSHWRDLSPHEPLPPQEAAFFEPRMARIETFMPDVRKLADRPRGRFPITYTKDMIGTLLPHVHKVRELANVLRQDACWQAHQGDLELALLSCRAGINNARSLDGEPLLISQLVRTACIRETLAGLQRTLAAGEASAVSLPALQQALLDADRLDSSIVGVRGERAGMHILCTNLENGSVSTRGLAAAMAGARPGAAFSISDRAEELLLLTSVPASHVWLLQHFTDGIAACRLPGAEQEARIKELNQAPGNAPMLAKILTPGWIRCHKSFRAIRTHLRCATVAVAVERYRLKHGHWPVDLTALTPEYFTSIPADPYTDTPLKYRMTADGAVVFSVGPDGSHRGDFQDRARPDDPAATAGQPNRGELEFRLWNPEARRR